MIELELSRDPWAGRYKAAFVFYFSYLIHGCHVWRLVGPADKGGGRIERQLTSIPVAMCNRRLVHAEKPNAEAQRMPCILLRNSMSYYQSYRDLFEDGCLVVR